MSSAMSYFTADRKGMIEASINKIEKAEKEQKSKDLKLRKAHHKKLRKQLAINFALTTKEVVRIFDAIGVFSPVMDAAGGIIEIFSGRMQEQLMPSMMGIVDALLGEEMMGALDLVATGFSTILDPLLTALGTAIAAAPIGTALGVAIGGLIGSFAGNAQLGALIGGALGLAIETAPIGATMGGIVGGAIGSVLGPYGAMIAAPIGAALGALFEKSITPLINYWAEEERRLRDKARAKATYRKGIQQPGQFGAALLGGATAAQMGAAALGNFSLDDLRFPAMKQQGPTQSIAVPAGGFQEGGGGAISITIEGNLVGQNAMKELLEEIEYRKSIGRL